MGPIFRTGENRGMTPPPRGAVVVCSGLHSSGFVVVALAGIRAWRFSPGKLGGGMNSALLEGREVAHCCTTVAVQDVKSSPVTIITTADKA